ncbi:putative Transcription factor HES-4-like [Homarus americanus]|uniref:Putative Transcription factor HES-4-like n=2 Tax=Homarus americanus TaxID=6706 RepID=A0A8J5N453_HOMAM|nr:putative Transcription factor HES-4-like [Homarus americanus]
MDEVPIPTASPQQELPTGVPLVQTRLVSSQLALVLPSWAAISSRNSSPTNATSPEAGGAPSSPESARSSPQGAPDFPKDCASPETYTRIARPASSCLESSFDHSIPPEVAVGHQPDPQVAPLDLATPHRRIGVVAPTPPIQQSFTVAVGLTRSPPTLKPKATVLPRLVVTPAIQRPTKYVSLPSVAPYQCRLCPYPAHYHQQNPHWRPW